MPIMSNLQRALLPVVAGCPCRDTRRPREGVLSVTALFRQLRPNDFDSRQMRDRA
jgi:hypothetical protein